MIILIFLFIFGSVVMLTYFSMEVLAPYFINTYNRFQGKRATKLTESLEESFIFWEKRKVLFLSLSPLIFAGIGFFLLKNILGMALGILWGLGFPNFMARMAKRNRIKKFQSQLVDSLLILSSSLKAGLSFIQAIEVVCEEMPAPISQEFNLVLKENKLGLSLEESLQGLRIRIPLEEVNLLVSSILVAREAGGELPKVFSRLTDTIRNNLKLKEKIATLTLQGRLQAIIMLFLPFAFTYFVYKQNPEHFSIMLENSLGRTLLIVAVIAQIVGMYLIKRISTIRI